MPYYSVTWIARYRLIASSFIMSSSCGSIINLSKLSGYWILSYFQKTYINVLRFVQQIKHIHEKYRKEWLYFYAWFGVFQLTIHYSEIFQQLEFIMVKTFKYFFIYWFLFFFYYSWFRVFCQFSTVHHGDPVTHTCIHSFFWHYHAPS